jgi:nuclear pore complex protein Nup54
MEKWDPGNPNCAFKTYFYNKVDEANIPFYRPLPNEDPREWEEALEKKPAPGFIPVKCTSFTGIADRLKTQRRAVADLNTRLHQINGGLDVLLSRHDLQTTVRTAAAHRRNALLHDRCLGLAAKVQVLRNRGYTLSGDEDDLRLKLKALETSIQDPALAAREEELWSRLVVIRGYADRLTEEVKKAKSKDGETLDSDSERGMRKVWNRTCCCKTSGSALTFWQKFLEESETQLQHLKREVESIQNDFAAWEKESNGS